MSFTDRKGNEVLSGSDLDVKGVQFGFRFTEGCSNGCVELYTEDDENWFLQSKFDRFWLKDLVRVTNEAIEKMG